MLTKEQLAEIENRHFEAHNLPWNRNAVHHLGNAAHIHRGKLLRHIRALEAKLADQAFDLKNAAEEQRLGLIERDGLRAKLAERDEKLGRVTETMEAHKQCRQQCNCLELLDAILNGSKGSKP